MFNKLSLIILGYLVNMNYDMFSSDLFVIINFLSFSLQLNMFAKRSQGLRVIFLLYITDTSMITASLLIVVEYHGVIPM